MTRRLPIALLGIALLNGLFTPSSGGAQSPAAAADLVLLNGRVWTGGDRNSFAQALAIRGNRIVQVGTNDQIKLLADDSTRVIQLDKKLVIPGFNDAHIHFLGGSLGLTEVDLTGANTVAEMLERIAAYAKRHPDIPWIRGRGWEYTRFPGGMPTKSYLDAIVRDRPVFLSAYDGHSAWVNSKALELAGVDQETKFSGFGKIVRNAAGEPTGALLEGAQGLVRRLLPEPTREQKLDALRQGLSLAASLGLTSLQNASGSPEEFELYEQLFRNGELNVRFSMAFSVGERTTSENIDRFVALKEKYDQNLRLRASSVKFMLDGVIESHTAAMIDRYSDLPATSTIPFGELAMTANGYREMVAKLDRLGFQIYTHAIGDRAVREALKAYELAQSANQRANTRHRIEHIETVSPDDLERFSPLGVMASMQPIHADPGTIEVWSRAVGPERLPLAFAWASMRKNRTALVFGSDWPACISIDPMRGIHNAVNRRTTDGRPPEGWVPEQRVTIEETLRAYTEMGAFSSFEEGVKGRIAPGMLADLVVLSQDLFSIKPIKIHETRVRLTVFDGKIIYQK